MCSLPSQHIAFSSAAITPLSLPASAPCGRSPSSDPAAFATACPGVFSSASPPRASRPRVASASSLPPPPQSPTLCPLPRCVGAPRATRRALR
eukprot:800322-Pleurochrysis_carterae.AAC.2